MTNETRNGLDLVYALCDVMEKIDFGPRVGIYQPPRQMLAMDLFHFLCIAAGADDRTSWDEVAVVNEVLKENKIQQLNPQEFAEEIRTVYCSDYGKQIPTSLKLFVSFDLNAKAEKKMMKIDGNVSDMLIAVYTMLGIELIASDREITTTEKDIVNGYVSKMKRYAMTELSRAEKGFQVEGTAFIGGKR